MHQCVICLGSNCEAEKNLSIACNRLESEIGTIEWGEAVYTPSEGTFKNSTYLNRGAKFHTHRSIDELTSFFKSVELLCGRTSDSKKSGIVPLDIDLLIFDGKPIKPNDLMKAYVKSALKGIRF